ncbi:MAG: dienelactone hydrolase [Spirochaetaceae bacterium]|nr:MAG: dienelactone hydrolase [Spirochaetaceae bacterium]
MASIVLSGTERPELQPATALRALLDGAATRAFTATTPESAAAWQRETRASLAERIGFQDWPAVDPAPESIESVGRGDLVREKIVIRTSRHTHLPLYLIRRRDLQTPAPTVIAFHGHGYGVKDIVGLWEDGSERETPDGYHTDFALALARLGFLVAAPEISCFGERSTDFSHLERPFGGPVPSTCAHTSALAFHLGGSTVGLRVLDARRLVDYLLTRDDVDGERIGAMGISGGGMQTFFSMCIDERIRAGVVSGYYCSHRFSIFDVFHCPCNYVPGLAEFGDVHDLVGLIAPRPLFVEAGTHDEIFPVEGVRRSVDLGSRVYRVFGASGYPEVEYFEGRHRINGDGAYRFLRERLAGERTEPVRLA